MISQFQATVLTIFGALHVTSSLFCASARNQITEKSGKITDNALWRGPRCNHTWIFNDLPNDFTMLVINITQPPLMKGILKLYGENFMDESKYKHCKILDHSRRTFEDYSDTLQVEKIHREIPNCKLRSGVEPPVTLTYVGTGDSHRFVKPKFTIEYTAVPVIPEEPLQTTTMKTTMTSERTTTTTVGDLIQPRTSTMTMILAILGGIVVLLFVFLVTALICRKRRMKHTVSNDEHQLSSFYQTILDDPSSDVTNGQIYNEIAAKKTSKKNEKSPKSESVGRQESVKNVVNPLYDTQPVNKHAYEYIEVRLPFNREEERSAI